MVSRIARNFLAQNHARRRLPVLAHGRQYHGIRIGLGGIRPRLLQPLGYRQQRIVGKRIGQGFGPI